MRRIILYLALWVFLFYNTAFSSVGNISWAKLVVPTICCRFIVYVGISLLPAIRITVKRNRGASTLAPATSLHPFKHDVFLCYSGETRKSFTDHLYKELRRGGINVFRDKQLERGTDLSSELLTAIEDSQFAIIVISPNYAFSSWCLRELSAIFESKVSGAILPVFYRVKPSHIRGVRGTFARAFRKHEHRHRNVTEVHEWRRFFRKLGGITGWVSQDWYESELTEDIVQYVRNAKSAHTYSELNDE